MSTIVVNRETAPTGRPIWVVYVDGACVAYARTQAAAQSIANTQAMLADQQARLREVQS